MIDNDLTDKRTMLILLLTDSYGNVLVRHEPYLLRRYDATIAYAMPNDGSTTSAMLQAASEQLGIQPWELVYTLQGYRPIVTDDEKKFQIFTGTYTGDIEELEISDDFGEIAWMSERDFEKVLFSNQFVDYPLAIKKAMFGALYF